MQRHAKPSSRDNENHTHTHTINHPSYKNLLIAPYISPNTSLQSSFLFSRADDASISVESSFKMEMCRMPATLASISALSNVTIELLRAVVELLRIILHLSSFVTERNRSALLMRRLSGPMQELRLKW
mmetsp:Transcript_14352/g.25689  ORF Transcript_14352/g.25689 Transcript_14352/m.25689 type:complete len:128 (+) Transcript_14352:107-490(+)